MIVDFMHKFTIFLFYFFGVFAFTVFLCAINTINIFERHFLCDTTTAHIKLRYDVIIVGAGTAGLTIAAGFDANTNVLIIEAGNDYGSPKAPISSLFARIVLNMPIVTPLLQLHDSFDWQHRTVAQTNACHGLTNNVSHWPMGKGFGGTQLINNMIYHRGNADDYRTWFTEAVEYNYTRDILPYFHEFEQLMEINELQHTSQLVNVLENATRQMNDKYNASEFVRPKVLQSDGRRWTVADTYHQLHLKHQLLLNTHVERILFDAKDNAQSATLRAIGVSYRQNGRIYDAFATKGIILSAGTIGSPVILQKSGIGPRRLYESGELNGTTHDASVIPIKLRMDLPAVGAYLQDHVTTGMDLIVLNQSLGLEPWHTYSPQQFFDYFVNGKGSLTTIGCEALGFIRTHLLRNDHNSSAPDIGLMVLPMGTTIDAGVYLRRVININERSWQQYFKPSISQTTISILPIVLHPKSRGTLTIRSSRSNEHIETIIDPNYLQHPDDIDVLVAGLKFISELIETQSFQALGAKLNSKLYPGCEHLAFASDEYWQCYVKHLTLTAFHPVGTCRMGHNDNDSVVNIDTFQVHNVDGLYVCDASIMPTMPSANPQAAVGMLATKFLHSFSRKKKID